MEHSYWKYINVLNENISTTEDIETLLEAVKDSTLETVARQPIYPS